MQEAHPKMTDLSLLIPRPKLFMHTDQSYHLLLVPFPEMPLIHIITFLIAAEVPTQGDRSTLWPTCLPQHERFTKLSPCYVCSRTHPICQRALFPATCCAFLGITKSISATTMPLKLHPTSPPTSFLFITLLQNWSWTPEQLGFSAKDSFRRSSLNNEDVTSPRTHDPSKTGISKASPSKQICQQASEVVVLYSSITNHLSGMKRAVCPYSRIMPDLALAQTKLCQYTAEQSTNY